MWSLLKKEINSFQNSLTGYIVVTLFLLFISLFMWVFPTDANVLDNGYADLSTLFVIAPWLFLFLIPAITMRSFSDEKNSGTIELLLTRPLSEINIILSKYFGALILVFFSLLPTLIFVLTIHQLGNPIGNIDIGGIWGSYIGLFLLGGTFTSIGIFASAITNNQIISFISSVFFCWFFWIGLENIASFEFLGSWDFIFLNLSINTHYNSLSRGVIDTRDVIYLLSFSCIFILLTKTILESRKW